MPDRQALIFQTRNRPALFARAACAAMALLFATTLPTAPADDANLKDGAKRAGNALGTVARDIGQGARKAGQAVGNAAKEGGREFRRAIKGESH